MADHPYEVAILAFGWFPLVYCLFVPRLRRQAVLGPVIGATVVLTVATWLGAQWAAQAYSWAVAVQVVSLGSFATFHLVWWPLVVPHLGQRRAGGPWPQPPQVAPVDIQSPPGLLGAFVPRFSGVYRLDALPEDLLPRLADRIRSGLFPGASAARNRYEVVEEGRDRVRFRSTGWLATINIGLNDVTLRREGEAIGYDVQMGGWTRYCVLLGAIVGVPCLAAYLVTAVLRSGSENALGPLAHVPIVGSIIFWCVLWPWVLTAFHKRPAARALHWLLHQVSQTTPIAE
jgi:hypothetical protein